ncbi:hypothetical protein KI387_040313, partial [Taxus chinensis]
AVKGRALSSSVAREKNLSFKKLNVQAHEFVHRVQWPGPVQMNTPTQWSVFVGFTPSPPLVSLSQQVVEQLQHKEPTVASTFATKPLTDEFRKKNLKQAN